MDRSLDWTLVQSFLAVAETGSLSAAAHALGQSQPTTGRHVKALESQLKVNLFDRHARGLTLSDAGAELLPHAKAVRDGIERLQLTAAGQQTDIEGTVRLTASVFVAHHVLPGILARLRQAEPRIDIALVASDASDNLLFREADIALRMYRPTQLDIVAQHIGDIPIGLFGTPARVAEVTGRTAKDVVKAGLVGFDADPGMIDAMAQLGLRVRPEDFPFRCDHQTVYWELVRAGCAIGFCQREVGRADPELVEVPMELEIPPLPLWLAASDTMRQVPRIRRVWDFLKEELSQYLAA